MENAWPGKWQNGTCAPWKLTEWKMHTLENGRKITPWKKTENASLENERMENAHPGNWQNNHTLEFDRKYNTGKCQNGKCTPWKLTEWRMHTLENVRKITPWKKTENASLENARMENAPPGNWQNYLTLEFDRKYNTGKCQNGKCTTWKMAEKTHHGIKQKIHNWFWT